MTGRFVKEKGITGDFLLNLLINKKIIGNKEIDEICRKQGENNTSIQRIILSSGIMSKEEMMQLLSEEIGVPYIDLDGKTFDPSIVAMLSEEISRKHNLATIGKNKEKIVVAMANPLDVYIHDEIRITTGFEIEPYLAFRDDINRVLDSVYGITENWQNMIGEITDLPVTAVEEEAEEMEITKSISESHEAPVIALVNLIMLRAIKEGASDIHIEPSGDNKKDIVNLTQKATNILEEHIRKNPTEWVWFHERWKTQEKDD